jgi:hypothetical protein
MAYSDVVHRWVGNGGAHLRRDDRLHTRHGSADDHANPYPLIRRDSASNRAASTDDDAYRRRSRDDRLGSCVDRDT